MLQEAYAPLPPSRALVIVATPGKRGRPKVYSPEVAEEILERLSSGESLRAICRDAGMPAESTVRKWAMNTNSPFSAQYAHAREIGYACIADELMEIADDQFADPARSRLQVDTRKWLLSKCLPKIFGDKVQHDHSGSVTVRHENMLDRVRQLEIEGKL